MTDEEHNKYIAFAFAAYGAFQVLMLVFIGLMFTFILSIGNQPGRPGPPLAFFGIFFTAMIIFQMIFTAPSFIASYALLKKKSWARMAAIVAGVLSAMSVPVGTAA